MNLFFDKEFIFQLNIMVLYPNLRICFIEATGRKNQNKRQHIRPNFYKPG
jgi:hypothetical protein